MKALRFYLLSIVLLVLSLGFPILAHADLNFLGQGTSVHGTYNLIYDTDLDITWYDYTSIDDTWQNQVDWADALSVTFGSITYTDWRLPSTVDGPRVYGYDGTTTAGFNITTSEMGHLFYTELGNHGYHDISGNPTPCLQFEPYCLTNSGDFQNFNVYGGHYWSGTEYANATGEAWNFSFTMGEQETLHKFIEINAIAVRPGLAVVPEPISSTLFIIGGATLGFKRFRKKLKG